MSRQNAVSLFILLQIIPSLFVCNHQRCYALDLNATESQNRTRTCGFGSSTKAQKDKNEAELTEYKNSLGRDRLNALKDSTIHVDVYFHVITNRDGVGQVTNEQVLKQMEILNDAFEGNESSYGECAVSSFTYGNTQRTPFHFNLVNLVRIESDGAFNLDSGASRRLQGELRKGSCADLNVFTGEYEELGEAHLPQFCPENGVDIDAPDSSDNVLISYKTLPDAKQSDLTNIYDQGDTLVHEVGHFLGLDHTFAGGCDGIGDLVEDTPPEEKPAFGCPVGRDTCPGGGPDPVHNFMNYVDDCCMYRFTAGQNERMILQAGLYRGLEEDTAESDTEEDDFDDTIDDWDDDDWEYIPEEDDVLDFLFQDDDEIGDDFDEFDCRKKYIDNRVKISLQKFIRGGKGMT